MAHIRQQLRNKVAALLRDATGCPVFVNRTKQISPQELPCVLINTDVDEVEYAALMSMRRDILMTIRVFEKSFHEVDDLLDALCVKIENALEGYTDIQAEEIKLGATKIDLFGEGDQPIAVAKMDYRVTFLSVTNSEQVI